MLLEEDQVESIIVHGVFVPTIHGARQNFHQGVSLYRFQSQKGI